VDVVQEYQNHFFDQQLDPRENESFCYTTNPHFGYIPCTIKKKNALRLRRSKEINVNEQTNNFDRGKNSSNGAPRRFQASTILCDCIPQCVLGSLQGDGYGGFRSAVDSGSEHVPIAKYFSAGTAAAAKEHNDTYRYLSPALLEMF